MVCVAIVSGTSDPAGGVKIPPYVALNDEPVLAKWLVVQRVAVKCLPIYMTCPIPLTLFTWLEMIPVFFMSTPACLPSCLAMWVPRRCVFLLDITGHIPNVEVVCIAHVMWIYNKNIIHRAEMLRLSHFRHCWVLNVLWGEWLEVCGWKQKREGFSWPSLPRHKSKRDVAIGVTDEQCSPFPSPCEHPQPSHMGRLIQFITTLSPWAS